MCARRFLTLIFILILIVVAGAFALFQFGDRVLLRQATPVGHYQEPLKGSGPDYSQIWNWVDHPELRRPPSFWHPTNFDPSTNFESKVAVFYVHPTTYLKRDRWNAPICENEECGEAGARAQLFVQSQASAFSDLAMGAIWAPRYRQASFGAFLLKNEDARKALDLAYSDVLAAFDTFLAAQPSAKPIILAGHSQGSLHLSRLLIDRKDALKGRLVAAYVVGWPLSVTADLPATGLPACASPQQTRCILSWQSFGEPANPDMILDAWIGTTGPTGAKRERVDMLCVNPLTGTAGGSAPPSANKGTLIPAANFTDASLAPGKVGARCEKGFLLIDGDIPNLGPYVLPGNNYHVYDYALFWGSIRADAERRLAAWRAR
jgi:hypothetical protein